MKYLVFLVIFSSSVGHAGWREYCGSALEGLAIKVQAAGGRILDTLNRQFVKEKDGQLIYSVQTPDGKFGTINLTETIKNPALLEIIKKRPELARFVPLFLNTFDLEWHVTEGSPARLLGTGTSRFFGCQVEVFVGRSEQGQEFASLELAGGDAALHQDFVNVVKLSAQEARGSRLTREQFGVPIQSSIGTRKDGTQIPITTVTVGSQIGDFKDAGIQLFQHINRHWHSVRALHTEP